MAFAGGGLNRPSSRDSAPGPRFFLFAVLSIVLMYFDQRDGWSERIRYVLQGAAYPMQVAVGSPGKLWDATRDLFQTRAALRTENAALRKREEELSLMAMRSAALENENARLRGLNDALPPLVTRHELADVVSADLGRLRQRLVVTWARRVARTARRPWWMPTACWASWCAWGRGARKSCCSPIPTTPCRWRLCAMACAPSPWARAIRANCRSPCR